MKSRQTFTANDRIRKRPEYKRIYDQGRKISSRSFVLFLLKNDLRRPRLGLTMTRRIGGAVERNRARRLLREWFRRKKKELPGVDLIVNGKIGIDRLTLSDLSREMNDRLSRVIPSGTRK